MPDWVPGASSIEITVALPTIPPRASMVRRALSSAFNQTLPPAAVAVAVDLDGNGAAYTRQEALSMVRTEWVAFLDDDDQFLPHHLETLARTAETTGADYVYSYFTDEHADPIGTFGLPFDYEHPKQTTVTVLVRTDLAKMVGFREPDPNRAAPGGFRFGEDYQFTLDCVALDARIVHVAQRTWRWNWHGGNLSGRPWKG